MRRLQLFVSVLSALAAAACLPVATTSPLGTTVPTTPDPQLTGVWKGRLGTSAAPDYVTFYPEHGGVRKILVTMPPGAEDEGGWMVLEARSVMLGSNRYLDVREIDEGGKPPDPKLGHVPVLYKITGDGFLALHLADENAARAAIAKGSIGGAVEPGEFGDVTITADGAALDSFFASAAGRALFTKAFGVLQRTD